MTGAEFRATRESLGLSPRQMGDWVHTHERNIERLEIDEWVTDTDGDRAERLGTYSERVEQLVEHTDALVERLETEARRRLRESKDQVTLLTFKNDPDYQAWASRLGRTIVRGLHIRNEDIELQAEILLMAGFTAEVVEAKIKKALGPDKSVDPMKMDRFPMPLPARWHRQVCARVVERVPEVALAYA